MTMSETGHHALKDMVELEMYLLARPAGRPWPMVPRRGKALPEVREPYCNPIESSAANELLKSGFIEYTSNVTLVVSKSGRDFYVREMRGR